MVGDGPATTPGSGIVEIKQNSGPVRFATHPDGGRGLLGRLDELGRRTPHDEELHAVGARDEGIRFACFDHGRVEGVERLVVERATAGQHEKDLRVIVRVHWSYETGRDAHHLAVEAPFAAREELATGLVGPRPRIEIEIRRVDRRDVECDVIEAKDLAHARETTHRSAAGTGVNVPPARRMNASRTRGSVEAAGDVWGGLMAGRTYDLVVRGGTVVDGTGTARRRVDVGVIGGRIAAVGLLGDATAHEVFDATGLIVAPGIVDAHTHYDPQVTFEPLATMSVYHGVTTVLAGNCGFSIAPTRTDDREFVARLFAKVEQMDPIAMSAIRWDFESFPEYLDAREGKLGINLACYIGHSNVRRWVMGDAGSERAATADEIDQMCDLVRVAMRAGAAGLSSSHAPTHLDGDDRPVPSRFSTRDELLALAAAAGESGPGSITYLPESAIGGVTPEDEDYLLALGKASGLPIIIQGLGGRNKVDAPTATWDRAHAFLNRATELGTPVYSILIARPPDRPLQLNEMCFHFLAVASWNRMLALAHDDRLAALRDPATRDELRFAVENYNRDPAKGTTTPPPLWNQVTVAHAARPENTKWNGRTIESLATETGKAPADVLLDLALEEDLATEFRWSWETPEWTAAVGEAQMDTRMIIGTSDGGAHLARDDGADWSSWYLRNWVIDRGRWSLEDGIRNITQLPAALLGFHDRGTIEIGKRADMFIFDPSVIKYRPFLNYDREKIKKILLDKFEE